MLPARRHGNCVLTPRLVLVLNERPVTIVILALSRDFAATLSRTRVSVSFFFSLSQGSPNLTNFDKSQMAFPTSPLTALLPNFVAMGGIHGWTPVFGVYLWTLPLDDHIPIY